jgi:hypothetical protein
MMAEIVGKCYERRGKISHLPCAGIILFRFYGYYLSLARPAIAGWGQHPGNLKTGFPPAIQRYVTFDFNLRPTIN